MKIHSPNETRGWSAGIFCASWRFKCTTKVSFCKIQRKISASGAGCEQEKKVFVVSWRGCMSIRCAGVSTSKTQQMFNVRDGGKYRRKHPSSATMVTGKGNRFRTENNVKNRKTGF